MDRHLLRIAELHALGNDERRAYCGRYFDARARRRLVPILGAATAALAVASFAALMGLLPYLRTGADNSFTAIWCLVWFIPCAYLGLRFARRAFAVERSVIREKLVHRFLSRRHPRCASCNYDLSGASPLPARPAVLRCPECGLINPAPLYDPAHAPG